MNVPGGGKNDIPNRLKRQFAILNVPEPSQAAVKHIFSSLIEVFVVYTLAVAYIGITQGRVLQCVLPAGKIQQARIQSYSSADRTASCSCNH